ncbi:hypothetical protein DKX15_18945, partial [Enterococcus faecium]
KADAVIGRQRQIEARGGDQVEGPQRCAADEPDGDERQTLAPRIAPNGLVQCSRLLQREWREDRRGRHPHEIALKSDRGGRGGLSD